MQLTLIVLQDMLQFELPYTPLQGKALSHKHISNRYLMISKER